MFCGALWGFTDCFYNSLISTVCSCDYEERVEIFQIFTFMIGVSNALILAINMGLNSLEIPPWVFMIFVLFL
jgi:hypothetical protein